MIKIDAKTPAEGFQQLTELATKALGGLLVIELVVIVIIAAMAMNGVKRSKVDFTFRALQIPAFIAWGLWLMSFFQK